MGEGRIENLQGQGKTKGGLKFGLELMARARVGTILSEGLAYLAEVPPDRPLVFATSHITDLDIPIAGSVLADRFTLGIAQISKLARDPRNIAGMLVTGIHNYFPIQYAGRRDAWIPGAIRIGDYEVMVRAMKDKGKAIMFAMHKPTYDHILPDRAGLGAVILAHMADALVIPIAIDVQVADKFIGKQGASASMSMLGQRPDAKVRVGNPLYLPPISAFDQWVEIMKKRKVPMDSETRQLMKDVHQKIRVQADDMMNIIASLLQKEKRGIWNAELQISKYHR